ncbi:MAG: hypothetical protein ACTSVO_07810 [Candidatus Heimdallarchaeaceae archaeon]
MKNRKIVLISLLVLVGFIAAGSLPTQAKTTTLNFSVMEHLVSTTGPAVQWIDECMVLHQKDNSWIFSINTDNVMTGLVYATAEVFRLDLITKLGGGKGTNHFIGVWTQAGEFEGLVLEWYGVTVLGFDHGITSGKFTSHGTLGDYKIFVKGDFASIYPGGPPLMTGFIRVYI